VISAFFIYP